MKKSCICNQQEIINKIRKLWSQHVYWTRFFIISTAEELKKLLTEHLNIAGELVNADKEKNTEKADILRKKWYANADDIAKFLSSINSYWCEQKWNEMMYSHLSMTEKEALEMGNYMTCGIIRQFFCN